MSIFNIISTYPKCDLCFQLLQYDNNEELKDITRCSNCLTWYHLKCEKQFYGKNYPNKKCFKCTSTPQSSDKCIVCGIQTGLMIQCNDSWIHILCLKSLNKFFVLKSQNNYSIKVHNLLKKKKRCEICDKKSYLLAVCNECNLSFHPYCAFQANFDIEESINGDSVLFPCGEKHKSFIKEMDDSFTGESDDREKYSDSISNNISFEDFKVKDKGKSDLIINCNTKIKNEVNFPNEENKNNFTIREEELKPLYSLKTLNMKSIKQKLINLGLYNQFAQNSLTLSTSNKLILDWRKLHCFFMEFSKDEAQNIFPIEYKKYITLHNEKEQEYKICTIIKRGQNYYAIYDTTNVVDKDITKATNPNEIPSTKPFDFLSRKRFLSRQNDKQTKDNSKLEKDNVKFLRGFKLNSLSNKILTLEKIASIYSIYENSLQLKSKKVEGYDFSSFVDSEIKIKELMLDKISKINSSIISKLHRIISNKSNTHNLNLFFTPSNLPLHKLSSQYNYISILNRLKGGVLKKPKNSTPDEGFCECCICFDFNPETLTPIVYCDKCNVGVHQSCYGIKHIPEKEYLCDICNSKVKNIKCVLCKGANGAMKKVDRLYWGHVTCIFISEYLMFTDYALLDKIEILQPLLFEHYCKICNNTGEVYKCKGCGEYYHFFCAYFKGFYLIIRTKKDERYPKETKGYAMILWCECGESGEWTKEDRDKQQKIRKALYQKM